MQRCHLLCVPWKGFPSHTLFFWEGPGIPGSVFIAPESGADILPGPTRSQESPPFVPWRKVGPKIAVCHFITAHRHVIPEHLWSKVTTVLLQLNPEQKAAAKCNSPSDKMIELYYTREKLLFDPVTSLKFVYFPFCSSRRD